MVFSSLEFLFLYLPISLFAVLISPAKIRNLTIFAVSLVFYSWGGAEHLPVMLVTVAADWLLALFIERASGKRAKKILLFFAVFFNLGLLFYFKYAETLLKIIFGDSPIKTVLPIGISFYTFQALSYVFDVYYGNTSAQRDPVTFGAYVTLFPQLIAGPIVKYREVERQLLSARRPTAAFAASGVRAFICGLAKKVLLANTAGAMWYTVSSFAEADRTAALAWLGLIFYSLHIYFDFSGYSDMAVGLGRIMGFEFPENFNYPYISESLTDFWRRWHITLSSWFREYVYIPLGGNRKGRVRMYINLFAVWLFTGLWHGATPNFALWGLYWFILLVLEKSVFSGIQKKLPRVLKHGFTLLFIAIGWLIFAFDDGERGLSYLRSLLCLSGAEAVNRADLYEIVRNASFLAISFFACTPLPKKLFFKVIGKTKWEGAVSFALSVIGFFLCIVYLVNSSYNPFLYFRF